MYCRMCGMEIPDDSRFCQACGVKVLRTDPPDTTTSETKHTLQDQTDSVQQDSINESVASAETSETSEVVTLSDSDSTVEDVVETSSSAPTPLLVDVYCRHPADGRIILHHVRAILQKLHIHAIAEGHASLPIWLNDRAISFAIVINKDVVYKGKRYDSQLLEECLVENKTGKVKPEEGKNPQESVDEKKATPNLISGSADEYFRGTQPGVMPSRPPLEPGVAPTHSVREDTNSGRTASDALSISDLQGAPTRSDLEYQISERGLAGAAALFGTTAAELQKLAKSNNIEVNTRHRPRQRSSPPKHSLLYSFTGRINRTDFWSVIVGMLIASFSTTLLAASQSDVLAGICIVGWTIVGGWVHMAVSWKRAHDIGRGGSFALLLLVPIVSFWPLIELGFRAGDAEPNAYGAPPN